MASYAIDNRMRDLSLILDNVWLVVCSIMVILAQVGFFMRETGCVKMHYNRTILAKTFLVISMSGLSFFITGYGLATEAKGGIMGEARFFGTRFDYNDYSQFLFHLSLCVMMATIATGSIAERTNTPTYIFFSFLTSGFIFPIGVAWVFNDGWL